MPGVQRGGRGNLRNKKGEEVTSVIFILVTMMRGLGGVGETRISIRM